MDNNVFTPQPAPQPAMQPIPQNASQPMSQSVMQQVAPAVQMPAQSIQSAQFAPVAKPKKSVWVIITIILLSLLSATFIGLFIWMYLNYDEAKTDVDGKIAVAVAEAKEEQASKDEAEFIEREKEPFKNFSGPIDYGELSFKYPKTWDLYVEKDAANGGDYNAYFNPGGVNPLGDNTVSALRVRILNKSFESVTAEYQKILSRKDSNLTVTAIKVNNVDANYYQGKIPNSQLEGCIVIFKNRDKTVILQTNSLLFQADFDKLLETVTFVL